VVIGGAMLFVVGAVVPPAAGAQTIVDEWAGVTLPPPPELKPVTVNPKETALLILDIVKPTCTSRPRCVASVPRITRLLAQARENGVAVIYSIVTGQTTADILPEVAPRAGEPSVASLPDKFLNTDLEKILKDRGIKAVIIVGTLSEGAVVTTGAGAALRGFKVILPVDGSSSMTLFAELYTAWHLANAPRVGPQTTLTKVDLIKY
jgi:nicotinamidase-related amidase